MAASSIGRTTYVKKEYGPALLQEIRRYRAKMRYRRKKVSLTSIAEVRELGMRR